MEISGYTLVRSDHPSSNKRIWCLYLLQKVFTFNVQYLQETICFELKIGGKTCNCLSLFRYPSQNQDDFETFTENLELNLENFVQKNPFLGLAIGDLNAKSSNCFCQDKRSFEGDAIENLTSQFGLYQVIRESTHILDTSSSCIDLIFTS